MSTPPSPHIIDVDAGNDVPGQNATSLGVDAENFTPGGKAYFAFTAAGRTLAKGTADVDQEGLTGWSAQIKPPLACGSSVLVHGKDLSSGVEADNASATVFCP
jgi:hypothetical protein